MLNQDTARALLAIADEAGARLVLMGDRHQLPAVGRGGVLDLAARFVAPEAHLELTVVHRFADPEYAELSLAMRTGEEPGEVFDTLVAKGLVQVHASDVERVDALAAEAVADLIARRDVRVLADTNERVGQLNATIRDHLIAAGKVDDQRVAATRSGQRVGVGDLVMTRQNNTEIGVANRDTWTVTHVDRAGNLTVTGEQGDRVLPADYARRKVELAYASTVHSAQGETVDAAHFALGENTGAASAYVALTRGREANTVHIVADNLDDARQQWVDTFGRDRADRGPAVAAQRVAVEAEKYAPQRPLAEALADLWQVWTADADLSERLADARERHDALRRVLAHNSEWQELKPGLLAAVSEAKQSATSAHALLDQVEKVVDEQVKNYSSELFREWEADRQRARIAGHQVLKTPGRFGRGTAAIRRAEEDLTQWGDKWRPAVPQLPEDIRRLAGRAAASWDSDLGIFDFAREQVERAHPELAAARADVGAADQAVTQAERRYGRARYDFYANTGGERGIGDAETALPKIEQRIARLTETRAQVKDATAALLREPTLQAVPAERLRVERDRWKQERHANEEASALAEQMAAQREARRSANYDFPSHNPPSRGMGISL
jgi:hypothetical protein